MNLTKKLTFDEQTLTVLRTLTWLEDGLLAVITSTLDRKQYEQVNKALEALGGKWNKKRQAHVFPADPRPHVEGLLETGVLNMERDGFFETPRAVVDQMLDLVPLRPNDLVLEPSGGKGAILRVLLDQPAGRRCFFDVVEKNTGRADYLKENFPEEFTNVMCRDFMGFRTNVTYTKVYMNPPFEASQDIDHIRHAYTMLRQDVGVLVSVMSGGAFFRTDRKASAFREWLDEIGDWKTEHLPPGSFKESGTGVNTRLIVVRK